MNVQEINRTATADDPPCALTTKDGAEGWCERHREFHEPGKQAHRLSQSADLVGARFRQLRDLFRKKREGTESRPVEPAAPPSAPLSAPPRTTVVHRKESPGPVAGFGPGTAVKKILSSRGISTSPGCSCNVVMKEMDEAGPAGCRARVHEFAGKMRKNASFMKLESRISAAVNIAITPMAKALWAKLTGAPMPEDKAYLSFTALILDACEMAEKSAESITVSDLPPAAELSAKAEAQAKLMEAAALSASPVAPPRAPGPIRWAVGLTAVPSRRKDLLPRTLKSLESAGFGGEHAPRLFVDGDRGPWEEFPNEATFRWPRCSKLLDGREVPCPWANWWLGMHELFMRQPDADRYVMFQDDVVAVKNLRQYMEVSPFPERGYVNLFAFMNNEILARPGAGKPGFVEAALLPLPSGLSGDELKRRLAQRFQCGRGALGLVFDREGLVELLGFADAVRRPLEHSAGRGLSRIDGGVVDSMNKLGRREWTHRPSLLQHLGKVSAVSRRVDPKTRESTPKVWRLEALTFPGEEFDAMTWIENREPAAAGKGA